MMKIFLKKFAIVFLVSLFLAGCVCYTPQIPSSVPDVDRDEYVQNVNEFLVILDKSSSMAEYYNGEVKLNTAKNVLHYMNESVAALELKGGVRTFGESGFDYGLTKIIYGMNNYAKADFASALNDVNYPLGGSPLDMALEAAKQDLSASKGQLAVIIVSDGKEMNDKPIQAVRALKDQYGDRLCISTVLIGNDAEGKQLLSSIVDAGTCGVAAQANDLLTASGMQDFVHRVFFAEKAKDSDGDGVHDVQDKCPGTPQGVSVDSKGCPYDTDGDGVYDYLDKCPNTPKGVAVDKNGCPFDSDGDGVYDYLDKCPGTLKGASVDQRGCWVIQNLLFATAKTKINPQSYPALNEVVKVLKSNPSATIEIQGHTDNVGKAAYNKDLSQKRAEAVKTYLIQKGVSSDRLSTRGWGFEKPIASNETKQGRAINRRVEINPIP